LVFGSVVHLDPTSPNSGFTEAISEQCCGTNEPQFGARDREERELADAKDGRAEAAGVISLAGRDVPRMGFGAMRLPGVWASDVARTQGVEVLRRAIELGVQVIDTAWYYGDHVANQLIVDALYPFSEDLLIATKLGYSRGAGGTLVPAVSPEELRAGNEQDRRSLRLTTVALTHLRWSGPREIVNGVSLTEALGTMVDMQREGNIEHIGLSNVTLVQLQEGLSMTSVASVSNAFGVGDQSDMDVLEFCSMNKIPYIPFFPLGAGRSPAQQTVDRVAAELHITSAELSLAWLLARSPIILPIPGTGSLNHVTENVGAASLKLTEQQVQRLQAVPLG
jgi:pyridoxine 4-dehydrogenase